MTQEDKGNCNKIVLARFDSREEAVAYEIEMHNKFDVVKNPLFYNKAKQTSTGFDTTGRVMSEEERAYRGERQKERFKEQGSPHKGRKLSPEHRLKLIKSLIGRTHSEATKKLMSEKAKGATNKAFVPWWYEVGGVRTEMYNTTPQEFADSLGVPLHRVKDRFRKGYEGKPLTKGPLKGYTFGRIRNEE
jgi:hypothetical protein